MSLRVPLPLVVAFALGLLAGSFRAQDAVQAPPSTTASMPASVRAVGPFTANTPGTEMQFGDDPGDANHIYVYHLNNWHPIRIDTLP